MTPNGSEPRILLGPRPEGPRAARELRGRGASDVIVTLSRRGALALTDCGERRVTALELDPVDATRAGHAFGAGVTTGPGKGRAPMQAVRMGIACGGHACTALGVIPELPRREQVDHFPSRVPEPEISERRDPASFTPS